MSGQFQPPPVRRTKPKMSRGRKAVLWTVGVFVGLIVIGAIGNATGAGKKNTAAVSTSSQTTAAVDTTTAAVPSSPAVSKPSSPAAAAHTSAAAVKTAAKPKPTPSPSCTLPDDRDLLVWYKVPTLQDSAQELGEVDLANCTPTVDTIMSTSPTGAGYCTEVAYADQNPGYNADATPAPRLKHVIEEVGAGC